MAKVQKDRQFKDKVEIFGPLATHTLFMKSATEEIWDGTEVR